MLWSWWRRTDTSRRARLIGKTAQSAALAAAAGELQKLEEARVQEQREAHVAAKVRKAGDPSQRTSKILCHQTAAFNVFSLKLSAAFELILWRGAVALKHQPTIGGGLRATAAVEEMCRKAPARRPSASCSSR